MSPLFAFGFGLGPMELCIIGGIGVLLFGKKLPEIGRSFGRTIVEFKKGIKGMEDIDGQTDATVNAALNAEKQKLTKPENLA